jgi:SAM-dependent MidA family methyltransferase
MTPLAETLKNTIRTSGPITLADYMASCLLHPQHGYYATRDPLGQAGDFTTAPEISQMFGEMIGLCLAQAWLDQNAPGQVTLAELGPGRGTLMQDILRATAKVPGFHNALHIHLVEASHPLRTEQKNRLGAWTVTWHDTVDDLPTDQPIFLVANEFFDALPVRQFRRDGSLWCEHVIGLDDAGQLTSGWSPPKPVADLEPRQVDTQEGDILEMSPHARNVTEAIGRRIADQGGTALILDYGDWGTLGDTVQAVKGHAPAGLLDTPGQCDLSAHVDFETIATAAPCRHTRLATQGMFLERLGITQRAQALAQNMHGDALTSHVAAHRRLTHPEEMGTLFKVIALYADGSAPPPGLTE